jgi:hypothetical protein
MEIIDVHTHAFPDSVADVAVPRLEKKGNVTSTLDGKLTTLLSSMNTAGIKTSVVASIATNPSQYQNIVAWSESIASDRFVPFPSVHPDDPEWETHLEEIAGKGFKGIKLQPYYQEFIIDEPRMLTFYGKLTDLGLILLLHTGFDIGFPRDRIADPVKVLHVVDELPDFKLITTHFGAWDDWDEAEKHILGKPIYMDIAFSIGFLDKDRAKRFILEHPQEYLLYGTDSPWGDQSWLIRTIEEFALPQERMERLFHRNAENLLGL